MRIGPDFQEEHSLADGTLLIVRAIRPSDREELVRGFARLSTESRARRFLTGPGELNEETLRYLTEVDFVDHVALVAGVVSPDLKAELGLGVARFVRIEPEIAEAAVTVIDDAQRKGIAKLLVTRLAEAARERGIRSFRAEVDAQNAPVRALLAEVGAIARFTSEETIVFDVPLAPAESAHADLRVIDRILRAAAETMAIVSRVVRIVREPAHSAAIEDAPPSSTK